MIKSNPSSPGITISSGIISVSVSAVIFKAFFPDVAVIISYRSDGIFEVND